MADQIRGAESAQTHASDSADQLSAPRQGKTVASDGENRTMSGWDPTDVPEGYSRVSPDEVQNSSSHQADSHPFDQGTDGRYNNSHAEKQLAAIHDGSPRSDSAPSRPIGVSNEMCGDCQRRFQQRATDQQRSQVVSDPSNTRVFHPDGTVETFPRS